MEALLVGFEECLDDAFHRCASVEGVVHRFVADPEHRGLGGLRDESVLVVLPGEVLVGGDEGVAEERHGGVLQVRISCECGGVGSGDVCESPEVERGREPRRRSRRSVDPEAMVGVRSTGMLNARRGGERTSRALNRELVLWRQG
ncbi:MAG: hypothetical protein HIU86_12185 [Acidobacteria bacterium]|nr:hypothetical protein [Acidobacteriota bacterium]